MIDSTSTTSIQEMNIFISYSRRDSAFVDRLVADLESHGHRPWCDRSAIRGGQLWQQQIVQGIQSCDAFLLLLSHHSVRSINVVKELSLAEANGKRILPVMIEAVEIPDTMEYQLAGIQMILFSSEGYEACLPLLFEGLRSHFTAAAEPSSSPRSACPLHDLSLAAGAAADRQLLIDTLLPVYGPMIKVIVERSQEPLEGDSLRRMHSTLLRAGVSEALLEKAMQASLQSAMRRPDPQQIREKLVLEFGPIVNLIVTPAWLEAWWHDQHQAEAELERRGIPEQLLLRLREMLHREG